MDVFINSAEAISPQNTFDTEEFLTDFINPEKKYFSCIAPDYKKFIDSKALRRMSRIVRMGVASSLKALKRADIEQPDAILVGTGLGCLEDTEKFLYQLIENNEALLNPTAFIQSTHNTVAGQIALYLGCKNYNLTFTQQDVSFETALIDAFLMLNDNKPLSVLLGGIDEMTENVYALLNKAGCTKKTIENIYNSNTKGYFPGEGACFFTLSNTPSNKNIAKISDVSVFNKIENENTLPVALLEIFEHRKITINDIDVLISGMNGDNEEDKHYQSIQGIFNESTHIAYKHIVGEYNTASGFAMWLGTNIIQKQFVPKFLKMNELQRQNLDNILIHNYSKNNEHSFILLSKC